MSVKQKLEKSAKTLTRFSGLVGGGLRLLFPFSNANVYFNITDGSPLTLEIRKMAATVSEGKTEPTTLEFIGSTENFLEIIKGKISFASAWINGKVKVKGVRNNLLNALTIGMVLGGV
ncbi:MAG: SCP2 sterol-binding domain-containing protein [Candidatus Helarchaeota archaeon]|nr:SCP2 sterol-binding domain-containing protein [Candidatus Helarchaeota archaeon]